MNNRLRNNEKLTMLDIANELNVSKTTISRAISGKGRIGKETRDKILAYIDSLGYMPNSVARGLAGSRTFNIGVVIPDNQDGGDAPFFKSALLGISEAAVKRNYDTVLIVVNDDDISGLERLVVNRKVDGIVMTRSDATGKMVPYLDKHNMPVILIGTDKKADVLHVDSDQKTGCKELTLHLLDSGAKSIAYLAGPKSHSIENIRFEGFQSAFKKAGIPVKNDFIYWNSSSEVEAIIDDVLMKGCDAIECSDDTICSKVMAILKRKNIQVPSKIQVASCFDSTELEKLGVTALHVDTRALSVQAGNLLIDSIDGNKPQQSNLLDCEVIYRKSTR